MTRGFARETPDPACYHPSQIRSPSATLARGPSARRFPLVVDPSFEPRPRFARGALVRQNVFVIAGGRSGQKVCWQVAGVRRDSWAKANPIQVEQSRRTARANITDPTDEELKSLGASLRERAAELRRESRAREREARKHKPPKRPVFGAPPKPPQEDSRLKDLAAKALAQAQRLAEDNASK